MLVFGGKLAYNYPFVGREGLAKRKEKKKVGLVSLGCPKNQVDSEVMLGSLLQAGYELTAEEAEADIVIVNTCGFIDQAKEESIETLLEMAELKKTGRCRALIATGCLTQRYSGDLLDQLPEIDAVVGTGDFPKIVSLCDALLNPKRTDDRPRLTETPTYLYQPETPRLRLGPKHWAYIKVSEGCNYRCSFCSIPSFRGDLQSRTVDSVVREAQALAAEGVIEINLIAQSLTSFGWDRRNKGELVTLLKALTRVDGIEWIRLFYTYPTDFTDALIDLIAEEEKICRYIDLPLQHIDDGILKKMNRKGKRREIERLIQKLRERIPEVTLRSTFIVGFPGETEKEYRTLSEFIRETEFDRLGIFTYSLEEGTSAHPLGDPVPEETKRKRRQTLLEMQRKISRRKQRKMIGTTQTVLIDGLSKESDLLLEGRLEGQAPDVDGVILINDTGGRVVNGGEFVSVRMTAAHDYDLVGEVVVESKQEAPLPMLSVLPSIQG
ncbi:MAG: 30S ribosomal protein S12 methylthiotransferase RimO [Nitrospirae bacterium]|nr:30S ribosomal protein S12 methylthiotransferase RimO [Candidatus Manganitrophaceae bacterium]